MALFPYKGGRNRTNPRCFIPSTSRREISFSQLKRDVVAVVAIAMEWMDIMIVVMDDYGWRHATEISIA